MIEGGRNSVDRYIEHFARTGLYDIDRPNIVTKSIADIHMGYKAWADANGEKEMSSSKLGTALSNLRVPGISGLNHTRSGWQRTYDLQKITEHYDKAYNVPQKIKRTIPEFEEALTPKELPILF
ncbi:MAG: hypothetical protein EOO46_21535 [Flavobacterium sp.]|nr:MAG: hypothetical protein EOO46_21535 [Flavobacterium sp.]